MRQLAFHLVGFTALAAALSSVACRSAVADFYDPLHAGGAGSGGAGPGSGGAAGTAGAGGGLPIECEGEPSQEPKIVNDDCGVFVDAAAPTSGDGTRASPFRSVAEAIDKGNKLRIFICGGPRSANYSESVTIELTGGVEMYGGFDQCPQGGDWTWSADPDLHAIITGPPNLPAVRVSNGKSKIQRVNITAPDATTPGASSIGLVVDSSELELRDLVVWAGVGEKGETSEAPVVDAPAGAPGEPGSDACMMPVGGKGGTSVCDSGVTAGGNGGPGGPVPGNTGNFGTDGTPLPDPNPDGSGLGGSLKADGTCKAGADGKAGNSGASGAGGADKGTLTINGISGGHGADGKSGALAQGGGGGAGSQGGNFCMAMAGPGASGGGGGAGGCGGKGGPGGKAGGSSIGIVSLSSTFTWNNVIVRTGAGGDGGAGAPGQPGGMGGPGAPGGGPGGGASVPGCNGGRGGIGGNGGAGGGGRGGHSIAIAFMGGIAPSTEQLALELGTAGDGGMGGTPGMNDGVKGMDGKLFDFSQ